jgi:hypothetical protein
MVMPRDVLSIVVATSIAGCGGDRVHAADRHGQDAEAAAAVAPPIDISTTMRAASLAFRALDGMMVARHATHEARVDGGRVSVAPWRDAADGAPRYASALSLRTEHVGRGGGAACGGGARVIGEEGALRLERCEGWHERIVNTEEGVEQSWVFDSRPAGSGELVVRLSSEGQRFLGETDGGLHFVDDATGLGVRYGQATWIDARGERVAVAPRLERGEIVLRVPAGAVERAAYPAVLDPVIGPEQGMDTPVLALLDSPPTLSIPKVSYGNGQYLVVWEDRRFTPTKSALYVARVKTDGTVLDKTGIPIPSLYAKDVEHPDVAFDGTNWMVVWCRNGIWGTRVAPDGGVLDPDGIKLASTAASSPAIDFDGTNYLLGWFFDFGDKSKRYPYFGRYSVSGAALDGGGVALSAAGVAYDIPLVGTDLGNRLAVAHGKGVSVVAYTSSNTVYARRLSPDATFLDAGQTPLYSASVGSAKNTEVRLAFDGQRFLSTFLSSGLPVTRFISPDGTLSAAPSSPSGSAKARALSLLWGGSSYFASWTNVANGAGQTDAGVVVSINQSGSTSALVKPFAPVADGRFLGFDGTNLFFGLTPINGKPSGMYGGRLDTKLTPIDAAPFPITHTSNNQITPTVAWNGNSTLVVWEDNRTGMGSDLYASRLDEAGQVLDPKGIVISEAAGTQTHPRVAAAGSDFLVVWEDTRNGKPAIYGTRVSDDGQVKDPAGAKISQDPSTAATRPELSSDGDSYLVSWNRFDSSVGNDGSVWATRVGLDGVPKLAKGFAVAPSATTGSPFGVAWNGSNFLVLWYGTGYGGAGYYSSIISSQDTILDPKGTVIVPKSLTNSTAAVASDGNGFLVVWESAGVSSLPSDLQATVLDPVGAPTSPFPIDVSTEPNAQRLPKVAWNGAEYWVVWEDASPYSTRPPGLYAARLSSDGTLKDPNGIAISTLTRSETAPSITSMGPSRELVVYQTNDAAPPFGSVRVRARRIVEPGPDGTGCGADGDCTGGHCVDQVCCESACAGACQACSAAKTGGADGVCGAVADGTDPDADCNDGLACTMDACVSGACSKTQAANTCLIAGACFAPGDASPSDACASCAPSLDPTDWTPMVPCTPGAGGSSGAGGSQAGGGQAGTGAQAGAGQGGVATGGTAGANAGGSSAAGSGASGGSGGAGGGGPGGSGGANSGGEGGSSMAGGNGGAGGDSAGASGGTSAGGAAPGAGGSSGDGGSEAGGASSVGEGGAGGGKQQVCVPGQQIACACPGGGEGAQACSADGLSFGACSGCLPASGGPAGGGSGAAGPGGAAGSNGGAGLAPPSSPADAPAEDAGSCGCTGAGGHRQPTGAGAALALALALALRRRERGRR